MRSRLHSILWRLEREAAMLRQEPIRRVQIRSRALHPLRAWQFQAFGANSFIDRPAYLYGTRHISIGAGVTILAGSWLSVERPAWGRPDPALVIRDGVTIRTGCTISAAESILIESDVAIGGGVTIIDSRHTWIPGNPNVMAGPLESAPIRIGQGTWLAERATIAAGADIGRECAIGSNTVISGKVPDFSVVVGNPGRIVGSTRA